MQTLANTANKNREIIHKDLSYNIVGCLYKAHDILGRYSRESQYGDLLSELFTERGIEYEREKIISRTGNDINKVDFLIDKSVILELKVKPFIGRDDYFQVKRYLEILRLRLGIIVNFRQKYLKPKRIISPGNFN